VTLAVPLVYAAFEAAYWSLRQGFHELTLGGQGSQTTAGSCFSPSVRRCSSP